MDKKIYELRMKSKLTQAKVAELIGVSRQMYIMYENGTTEPSLTVLKKLCAIYNISMNYFFDEDVSMENGMIFVESPKFEKNENSYYSQIMKLLPMLLYSEKAKLLNNVAQSMTNDVEAGRLANKVYRINHKNTDIPAEFSVALENLKNISDDLNFDTKGEHWTREEIIGSSPIMTE